MNNAFELLEDMAASAIYSEYKRATELFPKPFNSAHEAYAVLLEEMDELWDAIKANDLKHAEYEAIQVGAMALKYLVQVNSDANTRD